MSHTKHTTTPSSQRHQDPDFTLSLFLSLNSSGSPPDDADHPIQSVPINCPTEEDEGKRKA